MCTYTKAESVQRVRQRLTLTTLWYFLDWPGALWINLPLTSPLRPGDPARTFVVKTAFTWLDHRDNSSGDTLTLLCRLRGCDPGRPTAAVVTEFLAFGVRAGLICADELSAEMPAEKPECQNVGISEPPSARPNVSRYDTFRARAREEKAAKSGYVTREEELMETDSPYTRAKKVGKKSADDLLALVPVDLPILQADLVTSARRPELTRRYIGIL
jgi:hypothetical protein